MVSDPQHISSRPSACAAAGLLVAAMIMAVPVAPARAQDREQASMLLDRLCAQTLRANEEDRLFGLISTAVRSTIKYHGGAFVPKLIDDAVQDSLGTVMASCPRLAAAEPAKRLNLAIDMVSDATTKLLQAGKTPDGTAYPRKEMAKTTAADLSQQLSSQEIDAWLNSLPPRQRAVALFLYASDVTPREVAAAVGEQPAALARQSGEGKADLLNFFRQDRPEGPASSANGGPALVYRESGQTLAALMPPAAATPVAAPAADAAPAAATDQPAPAPDAALPDAALAKLGSSMRVTGISGDLYSGWSLLATIAHLPRGQRVSIGEPFVLAPDAPGIKRMLVVDIAELGDPNADTRRFLLKAYAIDADKNGAGLRDSFHLGGTTIDAEAKKTLANAGLSSIEVARCLWHDYGTAPDPGLCR